MTTPHIPDDSPLSQALPRTTHLAIGAHQDDLEFMAYHGIVTCYDQADRWFTGVTCTDGAGSARTGPFAGLSDEEMQQVRHQEQIQAANLGQYTAQYQLGHPSGVIKNPSESPLAEELATIIRETRPEVIYTHQPADKHPTHLAVFAATVAALRSLPRDYHPQRFLGCEVWRDLDWLPDKRKVALDVSARPELAEKLNLLFQSQIAGGKNYHEAVMGRRTANATFSNPHATDEARHLTFALDLQPLLADPALCPRAFIAEHLAAFGHEVDSALSALLPA
ncbi:PIG-L deacetylase family protein [Roseibacillus ishigakijimensis]|uniref:PIG-L family deacetylase n=1 Tax=Roseibacillus ishigakijimensis TaxID=454146 RepID=A0A934RT83_9BACT|nr:PIG-L family deacetylase [Roseibacillus ishigakijimensis]MBK1833760.1 PIG-L family deacetylase [Roseibacillus ishigakijimensis]